MLLFELFCALFWAVSCCLSLVVVGTVVAGVISWWRYCRSMSLLCGNCDVNVCCRLLLYAVSCCCCGQLLFIAVFAWCLRCVVYSLVLFVVSCLMQIVCCVMLWSVLFDTDGVVAVCCVFLLLLVLLYVFLLALWFAACRSALLVAYDGLAVCWLCLSLLSIVVC